jgi:hypothetical protein
MRSDLLLYQLYSTLQLKDLDGATYNVRMIGYAEQAIEPYDATHPDGGILANVEFTSVD